MLTQLFFVLPAILLALYAQMRVKSAYAAASRIPPASGISGAEAASRILQANNLGNVGIEMVHGHLSDHYDPRTKTLRLSSDVYQGRSLAALGIAAHEAGHAIQDKTGYTPLVIRNGIVPLASIGGNLSAFVIMGGFLLGSAKLILVGVALYSLIVIFQLVNLPVEFDASARAKQILMSQGLISPAEQRTVSGVLNAAALTYVAATLGAVLHLLYYLFQLGLLGNSRDRE